MDNVERQEAHYGKGGLHSRHEPQILLQCLHQVTKIIDGPPDDPGRTQGGQGKEKPQVFKGEYHLAYCGTEGEPMREEDAIFNNLKKEF